MGKKGMFRFPVMILFRNAGYSMPQQIDLNILFHFHFHNQSALSSLSDMGVKNIKGFMKNVLIIKEPEQILKKISYWYNAVIMNLVQGYFSMMPHSIPSGYSGYRNRISSSNIVFRKPVQKEAIFPQISNRFSNIRGVQINIRTQHINTSQGGIEERSITPENPISFIDPWIYGKTSNRKKHTDKQSFSGIEGSRVAHPIFGNECRITLFKQNLDPRRYAVRSDILEDTVETSSQKTNSWITSSEFGYKSPAILIRNDSYKNNTFGRTSHPKSVYNIQHDIKADRFLSQFDYMQVINPRSYEARSDVKENIWDPSSQKIYSRIYSVCDYRSPAILVRNDSRQNNRFGYASHPKSVYNIKHEGKSDRFLRQFDYMQIINPRMHGPGNDGKEDTRNLAQKGNTSIIDSVFEHNTHAVLLNNDSIHNSNLKSDSYQQSNNALPIGNLKMFSGQDKLQITYPQSVGIRSDIEQANIQYIPSSQNKRTYQYFLMHRSPVNITGLMLSPISQRIVRNIFMNIGNRPSSKYVEHMQNIYLQTWKIMNPSFGKKRPSFMMKNENYVFNKTRKIEQEVDDLKKMVIETKKTLAEKSISPPSKNSGKFNLDINSIADQVYMNIERRIRIERERRGL